MGQDKGERNPKRVPDLPGGMSAEEKYWMDQMGTQAQGPSSYWQDAWGKGQEAYGQPGALDAIRSMFPQAGKYLAGAAKAGKAFEKSALMATRKGAQSAMTALGTSMGQRGGLGSTLHGVSGLDIGQRAMQQVADIKSQGAQMREAAMQGRMGQVIGGLGAYGQAAGEQRGQSLQAAYGMGQSALAQGEQQFGQAGTILGTLNQYRRQPYEDAMQQWLPYQQPGGGGFGPAALNLLGVGANIAFPGAGAAVGAATGGGPYGGIDWSGKKAKGGY